MRRLVRIVVVPIALAVAGPVFAEQSDVVKYRQAMMSANGGHMAAASTILGGKVPHKDHLGEHARAIEMLNKNIAALFPNGSEAESNTRSEAWTKRADFEKRANDARDKSAAFAKAVANNDPQASARFRELGTTCKGCHQDFRND